MLVNHADASLDRIPGRLKPDRFSVQLYLPFIGLIEAGKYAHQRRFARSVFAYKCVYFATAYVDLDPVISDDRAESLGDAAHGNCRRNWHFRRFHHGNGTGEYRRWQLRLLGANTSLFDSNGWVNARALK